MNPFVFLIESLFDLYIMVVLLRIWLQWARADFYNPFSQFVVKATQPVVRPLRRVIPALGPIDTASVLFALVLMVVKISLLTLIQSGALLPLMPLLLASVFKLVHDAFQLIFYVVLAGVIMSWIMQGYHPVAAALYQLTEPLLRPIRRILPTMGGLDFSPMVLLFGLQFLQYALGYLLSYAFR
ncbi:YggT family protein [Gallaecimonas kandeliae]|uniref:YggT family protein n=1 Tax=Gallaecimonas kandeliae TaxID=3029055 RepID=UPI002648881A|nr:YggT family protein [Gallaecimonas kandeliae]WKE66176.1 YggT family protein [Gallaecimonas kandeliae]